MSGHFMKCTKQFFSFFFFQSCRKTFYVVDHFYIALFSALQKTPCTLVTCDYRRVTVAFYCIFLTFFYPLKCCIYSAVWLLHGWCHMKLLPSWHILYTPCNHAPCHITSCKATYLGSCMFNCNLPPVFMAEWQGSFMCCCGNTGVERMDTRIRVSTGSWLWRRKFSCCFCQDSNLQPFSHESGTLTTELSPLPFYVSNCFKLYIKKACNKHPLVI